MYIQVYKSCAGFSSILKLSENVFDFQENEIGFSIDSEDFGEVERNSVLQDGTYLERRLSVTESDIERHDDIRTDISQSESDDNTEDITSQQHVIETCSWERRRPFAVSQF